MKGKREMSLDFSITACSRNVQFFWSQHFSCKAYIPSVNAHLSTLVSEANCCHGQASKMNSYCRKKYYSYFNLTVAFNWQIHCVLNWMLQTNKFPQINIDGCYWWTFLQHYVMCVYLNLMAQNINFHKTRILYGSAIE